jgi:hypothetical protein
MTDDSQPVALHFVEEIPDQVVPVHESVIRDFARWVAEVVRSEHAECISKYGWHNPHDLPNCPAFTDCPNCFGKRDERQCYQNILRAFGVTP